MSSPTPAVARVARRIGTVSKRNALIRQPRIWALYRGVNVIFFTVNAMAVAAATP
jgi:hypothetical protein